MSLFNLLKSKINLDLPFFLGTRKIRETMSLGEGSILVMAFMERRDSISSCKARLLGTEGEEIMGFKLTLEFKIWILYPYLTIFKTNVSLVMVSQLSKYLGRLPAGAKSLLGGGGVASGGGFMGALGLGVGGKILSFTKTASVGAFSSPTKGLLFITIIPRAPRTLAFRGNGTFLSLLNQNFFQSRSLFNEPICDLTKIVSEEGIMLDRNG